MRRKRKVYYDVSTEDDYWWVPSKRKWMKYEDRKGFFCSSSRHCKTFDQAMSTALSVPTGMVTITQIYWRKGHRWMRNYYYRRTRI